MFVGAKVEGQSGFINLMRIKSRYYTEGVFPKLQKDIEAALKPFPGFKQELFDKLYDFFHRYFSPSGSIYFQHTPAHKNIYEKVYTDDRDVVLFWKTHMLYYVKTDRLFNSLEVEVDDRKFFSDASTLEHKRANEKRELVYEFTGKREDGVLVFATAYSEKGRKTKLDDIMRQLHKLGVEVKEESVERAFRVFERQSEVDYFINKNAKAFLREQFDLWLFQYVFSGESEWTEQRIKQLQVLKDIALRNLGFVKSPTQAPNTVGVSLSPLFSQRVVQTSGCDSLRLDIVGRVAYSLAVAWTYLTGWIGSTMVCESLCLSCMKEPTGGGS